MNRLRMMIGAVALALLAVPLAACAGIGSVPGSPAEVADTTVLDEQGAIGVELAYSAFTLAAELAVDAKVLKGTNATRVAALDARAYNAVLTVRAAYRAGNADNYALALVEARDAIGQGVATIQGDTR